MASATYHSGIRGVVGFLTYFLGSDGVNRGAVIPAFTQVDSTGAEIPAVSALPDGASRSGTATTTSGGLSVAANPARRGLVGQNVGTVNIGFNEAGTTAAIGTAGTYTVPPGASFSVSTNKMINFICSTGTCAVTMTEY